MAWITVDQKLIGGKLRDFAKRSGISQNEAIGILIRLWLWRRSDNDKLPLLWYNSIRGSLFYL